MSFKSVGLKPYVLHAIAKLNYENLTPIQELAIPAVLKGQDILGIAPTGSGKTAAYAMPIIQMLERKTETRNRHINALVLVPTRELAVQVEGVFRSFTQDLPFRFKSMAVHGGVSINPQMIKMQHVNVLVATPGRLLELAASKALHFADLEMLVIDEADKMMNMGFRKEMAEVFALLPQHRQNLLFSATLSTDVKSVEEILLKEPLVIKLTKRLTQLV